MALILLHQLAMEHNLNDRVGGARFKPNLPKTHKNMCQSGAERWFYGRFGDPIQIKKIC
jgi:hypothetical protein